MTTVEILVRAKAEIQRCGWTQGGKGGGDTPSDSPCCPVIATIRVAPGKANAMDRLYAQSLLGRVVGNSVVLWNDSPARVVTDIYDAFDRAIALAEGGPNG